jgi:diacylglycerol kinase (ATP)
VQVAGGDGTVGWVLSCLGELQISSPSGNVPPVGIIPLGTGNDLSRSFGWGGGFSSASKGALRKLLIKTLSASLAPVDTWQVVVKPTAAIASTDIRFPHALHPQHHVPLPRTVSGTKDQKDENDPCFEGLFWNYFSIGMDAQVAYGFHHLRDEKPWLARGRVTNQVLPLPSGCAFSTNLQ